MEQRNGKSHTLPHNKHHNQKNHLEGETKPTMICLCTHYIGQHSCIRTYREYCCSYCTSKQGLDVIVHHFFSKYRQGVVIERIFVVHIKPPENSSSPCKWSQRKMCACKHKYIKSDAIVYLKVTYRADDDQNRQNPHQHFGDVTNDNHHDQGENWKKRDFSFKWPQCVGFIHIFICLWHFIHLLFDQHWL